MKDWKTVKQQLLNDASVRQAYTALEPEYQLSHDIIKARLAKKMTQAELAEKAGVSQVLVARLESGATNPTFSTVTRVANVLGKKLKLVTAR